MRILIAGSLLTVISWACAWGSFGILTAYSFFPLWIGFILTVNGLAEVLFATSLSRRMGYSFIWLFVISVPMWWFFERINHVVQNWHYETQPISNVHYFIQASTDFSTVIPAVLSTCFLFCYLVRRYTSRRGQPFAVRSSYLVTSFCIGVISFCILPIFPHETFPLVWIAPFLVLEPIAYCTGAPCVLRLLAEGKRTVPVSIMLGTFVCGFWWEFWNYYSYPRWYYTIWYVGCCKIFEMPLLGYLGYPFFGLIILSYAALVFSVFLRQDIFRWFPMDS
jgi:hypothetical protein